MEVAVSFAIHGTPSIATRCRACGNRRALQAAAQAMPTSEVEGSERRGVCTVGQHESMAHDAPRQAGASASGKWMQRCGAYSTVLRLCLATAARRSRRRRRRLRPDVTASDAALRAGRRPGTRRTATGSCTQGILVQMKGQPLDKHGWLAVQCGAVQCKALAAHRWWSSVPPQRISQALKHCCWQSRSPKARSHETWAVVASKGAEDAAVANRRLHTVSTGSHA
jgi:hypothetical protein